MKNILALTLTCFFLQACTNSIQSEIEINANLKEVWDYNGNNKNAPKWSIFFKEISACPIKDCPQNTNLTPLDKGFIRRCYRNADHTGIYWDEVNEKVFYTDDKAYRRIQTFNFNGYSDFIKNNFKTRVEQFYIAKSKNITKLIFKTSIEPIIEDKNLNFFERKYLQFSFSLVGSRTKNIFSKNLENIKYAIEEKEDYKMRHPYERFCDASKWYCTKKMSISDGYR